MVCVTSSRTPSINRHDLDDCDEVYRFAGSVLGSKWEFPDGTVRKVEKVIRQDEREQATRVYYAELRFDRGPRLPARGFRERIAPTDIGDVEPVGELAHQVVEVL